MKFGKRLSQEAARYAEWGQFFFDYRAIKTAIKADIQAGDVRGTAFEGVLVRELGKVSTFYLDRAGELELTLSSSSPDPEVLLRIQTEVQGLIKYVALNYLAVVKAIKKRNRHLKETFGEEASTSLHALDLLGHEVFFTSPRLASLATQAEILAAAATKTLSDAAAAAGGSGQGLTSSSPSSATTATFKPSPPRRPQLEEEYQCPICLDTLHNPVVLTCAHRFCWGCLVAHCTASRDNRLPLIGKRKEGAPSPYAEEDQTMTEGGGEGSRTYRVLEHIARCEDEAHAFYNCPVCRKPQVLEGGVESLHVDTALAEFIESLGIPAFSRISLKSSSSPSVSASLPKPLPMTPWGILPPQSPADHGKLTVFLDLDGTLISSFTPRRAPRLPPTIRTHVCGVGSKLNPQGVYVVERPGLREFLEELSSFAEVIIFTAGLEDYAKPIVDVIDPLRRMSSLRIYREGCVKTEFYQCVKDMARVNRDLKRTVLVDDTPLAFLHQPDNGIPVLGFRGDPDDRLLLEAVLPLLQSLHSEPDVRTVLSRRFDMTPWFRRNGFPVDKVMAASLKDAAEERARHERLGLPCGTRVATPEQLASLLPSAVTSTPSTPGKGQQQSSSSGTPPSPGSDLAAAVEQQRSKALSGVARLPAPTHDWLVLAALDKVLVDFDPYERLVEQLAPEILPMIVGLDPTTSSVPLINSVLAELQRRGVTRDHLVTTLQEIGSSEVPPSSLALLRTTRAHPGGCLVQVTSASNTCFVTHLFSGAKAACLVDDVIANAAAFERARGEGGGSEGGAAAATGSSSNVGQKLVICPTASYASCTSPSTTPPTPQPCCTRCSQSFLASSVGDAGCCRGLEVAVAKHRHQFRRGVLLLGESNREICAALELGPEDHILAKAGSALATCLQSGEGRGKVKAQVRVWSSQEELAEVVAQILRMDRG